MMKILTSDSNAYANIFVLHDVNLAIRYCDHAILVFGNGHVTQGTCTEILTEENLTKLYQHPLQEICHQEQRWFIPA